jgi:hypothetical protein
VAAERCRIALGAFHRYVIVNAEDAKLAWSGSKWVPHEWGIPTSAVAVSNFTTFEDAHANAKEHGLEVVE